MINNIPDLRDAIYNGLESETYRDDRIGLELTDLRLGDYYELLNDIVEFSVIGTDANTGHEVQVSFSIDGDDYYASGEVDKIDINTGSNIIELNVLDTGDNPSIIDIRVFDADKGYDSSGENGSGVVSRCIHPDSERTIENIVKDPDKAVEDVLSHRADTGIGAQVDMIYENGSLVTQVEYNEDGSVATSVDFTNDVETGISQDGSPDSGSETETGDNETTDVDLPSAEESLAETFTAYIDGELTIGDVASRIEEIIQGVGEETGSIICAEAVGIAVSNIADNINEAVEERLGNSEKIDIDVSNKQDEKPQGFIENVVSKISSIVDTIKNAISDKFEKFAEKIESFAKSGVVKGAVVGLVVGVVVTAGMTASNDHKPDVSREAGSIRIELTKGEDGNVSGTVKATSNDITGSGVAGRTDSIANINLVENDGHISGEAAFAENRIESDGDVEKSGGELQITGEIGPDTIVIDIDSIVNSCSASEAVSEAINLENAGEDVKEQFVDQSEDVNVDQDNDNTDSNLEDERDYTDNSDRDSVD